MRYGYFDNINKEYVIDRPDVPVSWTNYLGLKDLCTVISHNAGGYSFYKSTEHHRVTRFRQNGIPLDRPGHYVYVRDRSAPVASRPLLLVASGPDPTAGRHPGPLGRPANHGLSRPPRS